jgi:hypothetical protein
VIAVIGSVKDANSALDKLTGGLCISKFDRDCDGVRCVIVIECGDVAVVRPTEGIRTNIDWTMHQIAARAANVVVVAPGVPLQILPFMRVDAGTPVITCAEASDAAWTAALAAAVAAARGGDKSRLSAEEIVALCEAQNGGGAVTFATAALAESDGPPRR